MVKTLFAMLVAAACVLGVAGTGEAQHYARSTRTVVVVQPVRVARTSCGYGGGYRVPVCTRVVVGYNCYGQPIFRTVCH